MTTIEARPLFELASGNFIFEASEGGKVTIGVRKDGGDAVADYKSGSLLLTDSDRNIIVGPIDPRAAYGLAMAVCNLDSKAITQPQSIHVLAVALLSMMQFEIDRRLPPKGGRATKPSAGGEASDA